MAPSRAAPRLVSASTPYHARRVVEELAVEHERLALDQTVHGVDERRARHLLRFEAPHQREQPLVPPQNQLCARGGRLSTVAVCARARTNAYTPSQRTFQQSFAVVRDGAVLRENGGDQEELPRVGFNDRHRSRLRGDLGTESPSAWQRKRISPVEKLFKCVANPPIYEDTPASLRASGLAWLSRRLAGSEDVTTRGVGG